MTVVTMPDGTPVDFGNLPPEQIRSLIQQKFPDAAKTAAPGYGQAAGPVQSVNAPEVPATGRPSLVEDALKGGASGLIEGVHGIAGLGGDLEVAGRKGFGMASDFLGRLQGLPSKEDIARIAGVTLPPEKPMDPLLPTTGEVEDFTGFKPYEAQRWSGKFANTVGKFVPAAAAFGGAGTVGNLVKTAVAPAVVSEGAGQIAEGVGLPKEVSNTLRVVGAVAAGGMVNLAKKPLWEAPPTKAFQERATELYDQAKTLDMRVAPTPVARMVDDIEHTVKEWGAKGRDQPRSLGALKDLQKYRGGTMTLQDVEKEQQSLARIERESVIPVTGDASSDAELAGIIRDKIDQHWALWDNKTSVISNSPHDPRLVHSIIKEARLNHRIRRKSEILDEAFYRAKISEAGTRGQMDDALRTQFRRILGNKKMRARFSHDERAAMENVAEANHTERAARLLGAFGFEAQKSPRTAIMGSILGGMVGGPMAAAAVPIIGTTANRLASKITLGQAERASAMVRGGAKTTPWEIAKRFGKRASNTGKRLGYEGALGAGALLGR